ncbi:hypothetical protein V1478_011999 [Vespula squamosa]|uniref:Uncharacterized protein n=1 Tax=Vespula squamosa TaxID=30214 RepID=A0ABD2ABY2_VESSQ
MDSHRHHSVRLLQKLLWQAGPIEDPITIRGCAEMMSVVSLRKLVNHIIDIFAKLPSDCLRSRHKGFRDLKARKSPSWIGPWLSRVFHRAGTEDLPGPSWELPPAEAAPAFGERLYGRPQGRREGVDRSKAPLLFEQPVHVRAASGKWLLPLAEGTADQPGGVDLCTEEATHPSNSSGTPSQISTITTTTTTTTTTAVAAAL